MLSVVVVNINRCELLEKCLLSIYREAGELRLEVIVVDNDSSDGSPEMVRKRFPQVRLLRTAGCKGFAENYNTGIRAATGQHVLILNNDTELLCNADGGRLLPAMVERLDREVWIGCLGPMLVYPDGTIQIECARGSLTPRNLAYRALWLDRLFPQHTAFGALNMSYWDHATERTVDTILGACMLVRKCLLERVGGFDERFFLMSEDIDLCKAIRDAGAGILYCPQFRVMHLGSQTVGTRESYAPRIEATLSHYKYFRKHFGIGYAMCFHVLAAALLLAKILLIENRLIASKLGRPALPIRDRLAACASILGWRSLYTGQRVTLRS